MTSGKRLYFFNENAFDNITTPEQTYWLGFIYGDGSVNKYNLRLELSQKDKNHLIKLCNFMEFDGKIKDTKKECCKVEFNSKYLTQSLLQYGIIPNKTHNYIQPTFPTEFSADFYRGLIDSDGWVTAHKIKNVNNNSNEHNYYKVQYEYGLSSNHMALLKLFREYLYCELNKTKLGCLTKARTVNQFIIGGNNNFKNISKLLYSDPSMYLDRKYIFIQNALEDITTRKRKKRIPN